MAKFEREMLGHHDEKRHECQRGTSPRLTNLSAQIPSACKQSLDFRGMAGERLRSRVRRGIIMTSGESRREKFAIKARRGSFEAL